MFSNIEDLSNSQIKQELRDRYGVSDLADCIEPGDLQKRLAHIRGSSPITHGMHYGPLLQIGNTSSPTGIVTLCHGLGDSAHGWEDVGYELARKLPYLLFLLPTAPNRSVTINGGAAMPAWYDIMGMISSGVRSGKQDAVGVKQSCDYIESLVHCACTQKKISPKRVVYAGFSQGAALSLAAGLTASVAPAGIAAMSGYLAAAGDILPRILNKQTPISMFHGRQDPVVPFDAAKETMTLLKENGVDANIMKFYEYNMGHSAVPQEISDLEKFIREVLPEGSSAL